MPGITRGTATCTPMEEGWSVSLLDRVPILCRFENRADKS